MKKRLFRRIIIATVLLIGMAFGTKVEAANQGPYIKDGSIVQINKKNYELWQNFNWKKKNSTNNIYQKLFRLVGVINIKMVRLIIPYLTIEATGKGI